MKKGLGIILIIVLFQLLLSAGVESSSLQISGYWGKPGYDQVIVKGRYAYLLSKSAGLKIADIGNRFQPRVISHFRLNTLYAEMVLSGKHLFINLQGEKILALDIANPFAPKVVGTFPGPFPGSGLIIKGNYLYMAQAHKGLLILDIADPANIKKVAHLPEKIGWIHFAGDYAFMFEYRKLSLMDFSNPLAPTGIQTWEKEGWFSDFSISGDRVVLSHNWLDPITAPGDVLSEFWVFDISDIKNFRFLGATSVFRNINRMVYSKGWLTVSYYSDRLESYRLTEDIRLRPAGALIDESSSWRYANLLHEGDYLYGLDSSRGMRILSASGPAPASLLGSLQGNGELGAMQAQGQYVYVAGQEGGFYVLDISNPIRPRTVGYADLPEGAVQGVFINGFMYLVDDNGVLSVVDCRNPESPIQTARITDENGFRHLTVFRDYLLAASDSALHVMNLSNPEQPSVLSRFETSFCMNSNSITVLDSQVFYSHCGQLASVNLEDPKNPVFQGVSNIRCHFIKSWGKYLLAQQFNTGLMVLDPSNPLSPKVLSTHREFPYDALEVDDRYLYLYDIMKGLRIYEYSNPAHLEEKSRVILTDHLNNPYYPVSILKAGENVICNITKGHELCIVNITGEVPRPVELTIDKTRLSFTLPQGEEGETAPKPQYITVSNAAGGEFHWNAEADAEVMWLFHISPKSGSGTGLIEIRPKTGGLVFREGYIGDIVITSPESSSDGIRAQVEAQRR